MRRFHIRNESSVECRFDITVVFRSFQTFSNCTCSYGQNTKNNEVKLGFCQSDCGVFPYLYFVFGFINSVLVCTAIIPCTICTMRFLSFLYIRFFIHLHFCEYLSAWSTEKTGRFCLLISKWGKPSVLWEYTIITVGGISLVLS